MTPRLLFCLILSGIGIAAQAQVYKWVDAQGNITYSDVPPAKAGVQVETKRFSEPAESTVALPFELAEAVRNMPVTLYTSAKCAPCDDGRSFLKQNGIPFSEKTVSTNADLEKLNAIAGTPELPLVTIGKRKFKGYNAPDWRSGLSQAGYPESNILPPDYNYPAPHSAAPAIAPKAASTRPPDQTAVPQRDPNGFQF